MAALTPITRDEMRSLKAQTDEKMRIQQIQQYVKTIYEKVIQFAKTSTETKWGHDTNNNMQYGFRREFSIANIDDILSGLRELFPGCSVEFKSVTMARGPDGQMHDVSTLDPKAMMFMSHTQITQCITIDWS
jgi:hypothetical protein